MYESTLHTYVRAISINETCLYKSTGTLEVGVHIADVSHFVTPGTALDKIAGQRATSVYLVQKVR